MRRALMGLNLYGCEAVWHKGKNRQKINQSMPFASINPTNPRTNPWNFHKKILRIGDFEKWPFFESAILNFFFEKKKFFFCFIPMKISHKLCVRMAVTQFLLLWWFTAKNEGGNHKWALVYLYLKEQCQATMASLVQDLLPSIHISIGNSSTYKAVRISPSKYISAHGH